MNENLQYLTHKRRTILIVEDEEINREILAEILNQYEILYAADGEAALQTIRQHAEDLSIILLDVVMPKIDGTEVLRRIKEDPATKDIPVVVMTSETHEEERILELGAIDFLRKPYDNPGVIRARIANYIQFNESVRIINVESHDEITGLMNMRRFLNLADQERVRIYTEADRGGCGYAILFLNLANFKRVNITYGITAGDECLRSVAETLTDLFPDQLTARFADDHFVVLARCENLDEKLQEAQNRVEKIGAATNLHLMIGVRYLSEADATAAMASLCDEAKIACDTLKRKSAHVAVYDSAQSQEMERQAYIVDHLDEALALGYIQVYYQPVVRTLTGKLCSAEALTRWIDPVYGFLSPGVFIPVLEEAHLIHKLDAYVASEVGRQIRYQIDNALPKVPISFNLSRMDFLEGHPFETIERVARQYDLQHDYIRCEITESTLMADKEKMKEEIARLHNAGFEIWMDDFGSGYSSLNILKEFYFDEIKIDMMFLRNLNDQGRHILKSIVTMAKGLGIHTLVEGAETEEQIAFLKQIGCERIQGYYYGKPQPFEDMMQHCRDFGIAVETEAEQQLYERAGLTDLNTDAPLALILDDGSSFEPLYVNEEYCNTLATLGIESREQHVAGINSPFYGMDKKLHEFAIKPISSGEEEMLTFVSNGQYMRLQIKTLAGFDGTYIHKAELYNVTHNEDEERSRLFDSILRNAASIYRGIYLWDPEADTGLVVESYFAMEKVGSTVTDATEYFHNIMEKVVYPDDLPHFRRFMNAERASETIRNNGRGFISEEFRFRQPDGNYRWITLLLQIMYKMDHQPILMLIRDTGFDQQEYRESFAKRLIGAEDYDRYTAEGQKWSVDGELWRNLMQHSPVCYFWKDAQCRFVGASQSFLEAFGIQNIQEILGKTDEEIGWNLDNQRYAQDERDVLEKGIKIQNAGGICVIKGQPRAIAATKVPIYQNGRIIGLLGFFIDTEHAASYQKSWEHVSLEDEVTGCLNYHGAISAGIRFDEGYKDRDQNFIGIVLDVPEYELILQRYGLEIAKELLRRVADEIRDYISMDAVVARIDSAKFLIFERLADVNQARDEFGRFLQKLTDIHDIRGYACTLNPQYTFAWRSEVKSLDAMIAMLMDRLAIAEKEDYQRTLYSAERIVFDREKFDESDERIYITDPENYDLLYINRATLQDLGYPADYDIRGKKCHEVLLGAKEPCSFCSNPMCRRDRFYSWNFHNPSTGKDYLTRDTLIPWRDRQVKFSMSINLTNYKESLKEGQEFVYREMAINDAVSVAMQQADQNAGIQKLLQKLGEEFGADRAYIFEEEGKRVVSNTYEWVRKGISAEKENLQHIPEDVVDGFYSAFDRGEPIIIQDLEEWKDTSPLAYAMLKPQGIHSVIAVQLKSGNRELGFIGLDNPIMGNTGAITMMLETLSRFVTFMIRDRDYVQKLDDLSSRDTLTGVMNRRALRTVGAKIGANHSFAMIFGDLNGLKKMNDKEGHEAGDAMIRTAANVMSSLVGSDHVFRIGGDEFLILEELDSQDEADALLKKLRERCEQESVSVAFGCVWKEGGTTNLRDLEELAGEADRRMYLNKEYMHRNENAV